MMQLLNTFVAVSSPVNDTCHRLVFGFPTWYQYLSLGGDCSPKISSINDVWLIVAAVVDILLRVAALAAIGLVVYGGIKYSMSQGDPKETAGAKSTILNALVGLLIAVSAASIIQFVAGRFH